MAKYTTRTEQVDGGWVAHIDQDGSICIMQPNAPGKEGFFATQAEAKTWADFHAAELETNYEAGIAAEALKKEREEAAHQANLAIVAILERLTNPTA
jgi:hypothetical protein